MMREGYGGRGRYRDRARGRRASWPWALCLLTPPIVPPLSPLATPPHQPEADPLALQADPVENEGRHPEGGQEGQEQLLKHL